MHGWLGSFLVHKDLQNTLVTCALLHRLLYDELVLRSRQSSAYSQEETLCSTSAACMQH